MSRPIPMVDDLPLDYVGWVRHRIAGRGASVPVLGLEGDVQQGFGRSSHEVELSGIIVGEEAKSKLEDLQAKASTGDEIVFHADVTTALDVEHMVVVAAEFVETAGRPGRYDYYLQLRESPPLPPPAEVDPFGGLGDLGGLGFDDLGGVLDDIAGLADQVQGALDMVNDALGALDALVGLGDLAVGNPLEPIQAEGAKLAGVGDVAGAVEGLAGLLGGGS